MGNTRHNSRTAPPATTRINRFWFSSVVGLEGIVKEMNTNSIACARKTTVRDGRYREKKQTNKWVQSTSLSKTCGTRVCYLLCRTRWWPIVGAIANQMTSFCLFRKRGRNSIEWKSTKTGSWGQSLAQRPYQTRWRYGMKCLKKSMTTLRWITRKAGPDEKRKTQFLRNG